MFVPCYEFIDFFMLTMAAKDTPHQPRYTKTAKLITFKTVRHKDLHGKASHPEERPTVRIKEGWNRRF